MIHDKDGRLLAKVYAQRGEVDLGEAEANGNLFAAAPALLEACEAVLANLQWAAPDNAIVATKGVEACKLAIAQAKGRNAMKTKHMPTTPPEPPQRLLKSLDPTWPHWGVTPAGWNRKTLWFYRKGDAQRYMRTGFAQGTVAR